MNKQTRRSLTPFLLPTAAVLCGTLTVGCASNSGTDADVADSNPSLQSVQPAPTQRSAVARQGTLYERLGGANAVRRVVADFVARAASDPAVNFTREGHANAWEASPENVEHLKRQLFEYVSTLAGGPSEYQYRGKDLVTAHRGMGISNGEFDALTGHLSAALEANDIPRREREELLAAVASTRGAIVEAPDQSSPSTQQEVTQVEVNPDEPAAPVAPTDDASTDDGKSAETPADRYTDEPSETKARVDDSSADDSSDENSSSDYRRPAQSPARDDSEDDSSPERAQG